MEAIISSAETDLSYNEADLKRQELTDAKSLVEVTTQEMKSEIHINFINSVLKLKGKVYALTEVIISGVSDSIDEITKQLKKIKDEKIKLKVSCLGEENKGKKSFGRKSISPKLSRASNSQTQLVFSIFVAKSVTLFLFILQALEDNYERTLQDEAKELEQLLSKRNILQAKQEEYSNKIRELGPLSSDAFETYNFHLDFECSSLLH